MTLGWKSSFPKHVLPEMSFICHLNCICVLHLITCTHSLSAGSLGFLYECRNIYSCIKCTIFWKSHKKWLKYATVSWVCVLIFLFSCVSLYTWSSEVLFFVVTVLTFFSVCSDDMKVLSTSKYFHITCSAFTSVHSSSLHANSWHELA